MAEDDLSSWLKASAENKINAKNTWKSTLIEHFSDMSHFKGNRGVNFQKASCTLEGCVKVYSTRVDDVSEHTNKLLEMFSREEEDTKKKTTRRRTSFIEKNLANINLKCTEADDFYDPVFSSILLRNDDAFLLSVLEPTSSGFCLYRRSEGGIVYGDEKVDMECRLLPICAGLREGRATEMMQEEEREEEAASAQNEEADDGFEFDDGAGCDDSDELDNICANAEDGRDSGNGAEAVDGANNSYVFHETPFGYFKGWAGPGHWKLRQPAPQKTAATSRVREKFVIDFAQEQDFTGLFEKAETTISKEAILERRKTKNILPEDHSYERKDLYRFIIKDGYFSQRAGFAAGEVAAESEPGDLSTKFEQSMILSDNEGFGDISETAIAGDAEDTDYPAPANDAAGNTALASGALKIARAPKRVDIKRLKDNISSAVKNEHCSLSAIHRDVVTAYGAKEAKDISVHLCLISLLHLANENGFRLQENNNDILVIKS